PGDQDIRRLDVAMGDAFPMRSIQGVENLARILHDLFQRKRTFQRGSFDELHDEVVGAYIIEMANVRMIKRGNNLRFLGEALTKPARANLNRYIAVQARISGPVDFAHTAFAEQCRNFVRPELLPDPDTHKN